MAYRDDFDRPADFDLARSRSLSLVRLFERCRDGLPGAPFASPPPPPFGGPSLSRGRLLALLLLPPPTLPTSGVLADLWFRSAADDSPASLPPCLPPLTAGMLVRLPPDPPS